MRGREGTAAAWGARRRAPVAPGLSLGSRAGGRRKSFRAKHLLFLALALSTVLAPRPLCVCAAGADAAWFFLPTGADPRLEIAALPPDFDRAGWREVQLPHAFDPIQPQNGVFGWYACAFHVPKFLEGTDLVLDLGVIDDADATYLNGVKVGETGSFSDKRRSAWNQDRRYRAPASAVRFGEANLLAVQVKDFGRIGGFLGRPYIGAALAPPADPGKLSAELKALADSYAALQKEFAAAAILTLRSEGFGAFEARCRALIRQAERKKQPAPAVTFWWLAECRKVRADWAGSQSRFESYLAALRMETPARRRGEALVRAARRLARDGFRAEAVLAALRVAAEEGGGDAAARFAGLARALPRAALARVSERWLAANPFAPDKGAAKP